MSDDKLKEAMDWLRGVVHSFDLDDLTHEGALLDHLNGEPARLAARAEEVREACALHLARIWYGLPDGGVAALGTVACVRTTPLDSTPLADRIAELERERDEARRHIADLDQIDGALRKELTEARAALSRAEEGVRYWTEAAQAEARDAVEARAQAAELAAALGDLCEQVRRGAGLDTLEARAVLAKYEYEKARGG